MSIARVYRTKKTRKIWKCESCREEIPIGSGRISFSVGFRGREHTRCTKYGCFPKTSELESSAVATVYAAQEDNDPSGCVSTEDFTNARDDIVAACDEVADEYEQNEMYEINYDLQERAEMVRSAGEELANWEPEEEEPEDEDAEDYEERHQEWLDNTRDSFSDAVNSMDLP